VSSVPTRSSRLPRSPIGRVLALAALLAAQAVWVGSASAVAAVTRPIEEADPSAATAAAGLSPTIHWEEVQKHAGDRITFTAGDRVTVGFTPRPSDRWKVGGVEPRALPAGRLDGRRMRRDTLTTPAQAPAAPPATPEPAASPESQAAPETAPTASPIASPDATSSPSAAVDPGVDQPIVDPADVISAVGASWTGGPVAGDIDLQARVDPGALRREVFGFLPYWQVNSSSLSIQYDKISTIAYFGVGAAGDGTLMKLKADGSVTTGWGGWTSSRMTSIINDAHRTGTRVVLTVQSFAWNTSGTNSQKQLLSSSTNRLRLARTIVAAVRDRGADGVNLDFEPLVSGYGPQFTALVRTIRAEFDKVAKGYQITFDTLGYIGNYPIEDATAAGGADALFIMGYDYRTSAHSPVGSVAPLSRVGYDIRETVAAYTARVPASKVILGVPYYGRAWSTDSALLNANNISGVKYGASNPVIYTSALPLFADHGKNYDTKEQVAWTAYRRENCTATYGCVNPWRELYVDDARALGAKYALVNQYNLRGSGMWALGYDGTRPELWQAIEDAFVTDTVPPTVISSTLSSPYVSPNGDGRKDTVTVTMSVTGHIRWGYEIAPVVSGVVGAGIRSGTVESKTVKLVWDGQAQDGAPVADGRYRITIWVADVSDNRTIKTFDVIRDTVPMAVATTATPWVITPNGDGRSDTMLLAWTLAESATAGGRINAADGSIVRRWSKSGTSGSFTWDGRNAAGTWMKSGRYRYRIFADDKAGNRTVVDRPIAIDKTIVWLVWSSSSVKRGTSVTATYKLRRSARVTLAIYKGTTEVRRAYTERSVVAGTYSWRWNGRDQNGVLLPRSTYKAVITVTSSIATTKLSRTVTVE
jgi:spore germination protein YaaH/flagellar hook assembly protein FlgD